ncbi:MAG: hypothetical protein Q9164_001171 [Protoblastenia rupestris]
MIKPTVYTGTFIHTPSLGGLEVLANKAVGVDKDGVIRFIEDCPEASDDKIAFIEKVFQHMGSQVENLGEWEYVRGIGSSLDVLESNDDAKNTLLLFAFLSL